MDKFSALGMFVATAEQGSFSRAAELLGKTPSALTKAVGHLERELGAQLFERSTRRIVLTEAGRLYLDTARQVSRAGGEADAILADHPRDQPRQVARPLAQGQVVTGLDQVDEVIAQVDAQANLRVLGQEAGTDLIEKGLAERQRRGQPQAAVQAVLQLADLLARLVQALQHLARNPLPLTPQTLEQHDWLMYAHPALGRDGWWVVRDGVRIRLPHPQRVRLESDNYDLLLANAVAGNGVLHTPLWSVSPHLADGRLVRLMADYQIEPDAFGEDILAVYPSHRRATGKVQAFIDYLQRFLAFTLEADR